jgi:plastocyanin
MFELQIPDAGLYPFVTHSFAYTGLGSVGLIQVDPHAPDAPGTYEMMTTSFSAGVEPFAPGAAQPTPTATASPTGSGGPCEPAGTKLSITAEASMFSTDCLAAPAKKAFTIAFENKDAGVPHNVAIYTDSDAKTALFTGDLVTGPDSTTYEVGALDAGTYFFRCDVHPTTMTGTFIVA